MTKEDVINFLHDFIEHHEQQRDELEGFITTAALTDDEYDHCWWQLDEATRCAEAAYTILEALETV